uniref:Reverse transcriptase domain-containing protein n=1 Tax=Panagrellus redivivus TaxID=6233 RepID=A0A7E4UZN1_PANRE
MNGTGRTDYPNGFTLFHTGKTKFKPGERRATYQGVGIYLNTKLTKRVVDVTYRSEQMMDITLKLRGKCTLRIIQVHAPHSGRGEEEYENFIDELELFLASKRTSNFVIMGDFNANIGKKEDNERFRGPHSASTNRNPTGTMLCQFCERNGLHIGNSYFKKRSRRRWTFKAPNNELYEIDYIIVPRMPMLTDVNVINRFDAGSDHRIVRGSLRLKWKPKPRNVPKDRIRFLERKVFQDTIATMTQAIELNDAVSGYSNIVKMITEATEKATTWIERPARLSEATKNLFRIRRDLQHGTLPWPFPIAYVEFCKQIRLAVKHDLKEHRHRILARAIETGRLKEGKANLRYGKRHITKLHPLDAANITASDSIEEAVKTVSTFYTKLYKSLSGRFEFRPNLPINVKFTKEEVKKAMMKMKIRTAPGRDNVTPDSLRYGAITLSQLLTDLFNQIAEEGCLHEDMTFSRTILLYKKGDPLDIGNYRPISLLSTIYKVLTKVLAERIGATVVERGFLPPEQAGFRSSYSTIDHIHALSILAQKCYEYDIPLYVAFIDFQKAFDSVEFDAIWTALEECGVDDGIISMVKLLYGNGHSSINIQGKEAKYDTERGVRQGDTLSPLLFIITLQLALNRMQNRGLNIDGSVLRYLAYADDVAIPATSAESLKTAMESLSTEAKKVGLEINFKKTKWMRQNREPTKDEYISVFDDEIEFVTSFNYLGQLMSWPRNHDTEIARRISSMKTAYVKYRSFLSAPKTEMYLKRKLVNMVLMPTVLYGCETWALTKSAELRLLRGQRKLERCLLRVRLGDKVPSTTIREKTKLKDWVQAARGRKCKF